MYCLNVYLDVLIFDFCCAIAHCLVACLNLQKKNILQLKKLCGGVCIV
jgi:hypothetical protein